MVVFGMDMRGVNILSYLKQKTEWWLNKIGRNKYLDSENIKKLRSDKWNVITLFECKLKKGTIDSTLDTLIKKLNKILSK